MTEDNATGRFLTIERRDGPGLRVARSQAAPPAEAALWEPANLLNLTHDSIVVRDMDGVIRYWNRGAEELYGWTAEQALGCVEQDLLQTVFPTSLEQVLAEVLRAGRWEGELVHTRRDGGQVFVASRWSLQRDASGVPVAILTTNNDITERKRAELARQEIEEQWTAAFQSTPTMYFVVDAAGAIALVNRLGAEQLGYTIDELIGQPVTNVFYGPDQAFILSRATACLEQPGRMMQWEARKIRKDGTMVWVRETASAVVLKQRPVLLVVCEDITEKERAEENARRSAAELRDVIETIPALAWTTSRDGSNVFVNRRWTEYTGLSVEDTAGSGWQDTVHPEDIDRHVRKWHASLASGEPFEDEARFRRAADGEYRWFLVRGVPLRDAQGDIVKWYGTLTDIEDRRRADGLLAGERRILEMVARGDTLPRILDSICRLAEEHAKDTLTSILLLQDGRLTHVGRPSLPPAYVEAIDGLAIGPTAGSCGTAAYFGRQVIVSDIATDPLCDDFRDLVLPLFPSVRAVWSTPIMSSEGKVIGTFAMYYREPRTPSAKDQEIIEQITGLAGIAIQRKLTEERLRRSEAYLAEAQRLAHTGSWAWKPATGELLYWSAEMFRMFGMDQHEGVPTREAFWQSIHPDDRDRLREDLAEAVAEKRDWVVEHRLLLPDGTVKHHQAIGHPVLDAAGDIVEYVGTGIDTTERKRAEAERERLHQLESDLAHMNRVTMMGELTASLAHELNQPIAAAITNARACLRWLTRDQPDVQEAVAAVTNIVGNGTRAAEIIDRVRSFFKKDAPSRRVPIDVNAVAREMIVLLRNEASRHSIAMHIDLADLPNTVADRVQLQQVFMNLMLNGIEAMKDGGGDLTIRSRLSEAGELLISASDTGIGLPIGHTDQMFKAFFTTKPQGTGMGLAISRSIIESHGGRLWASANRPSGAVFQFTLPAERPQF